MQTTEEIQETIALWGDKYHNATISRKVIEFKILLTSFELMIPQRANSPWVLAADGKTLLRTNKTGRALLGIVEHKAIKRAKEDELKTLETHLNKARDYGWWDALLLRMVQNRLYRGNVYRGINAEERINNTLKIHVRQGYRFLLTFRKKDVYLELSLGSRDNRYTIGTTQIYKIDITDPKFDIYDAAEILAEQITELRQKINNQISLLNDFCVSEMIKIGPDTPS